MKTYYQVIIIGAGPAGSACGIVLQKRGVTNCLIEKAVFPRRKTCGGLVTEKTRLLLESLFQDGKSAAGSLAEHEDLPSEASSTNTLPRQAGRQDLSALFCDYTDNVTVYDKTTPLAQTTSSLGYHFVDRTVFDFELVKRYQNLGGTLLQGETAYTIDHEQRSISFPDGRKLTYQYLVYADGIHSQAHKLLPHVKPDVAFGIEAFVPKSLFLASRKRDSMGVGLHFGFLDNGYVWVFPKGEQVCIGLGGTYQRGVPYKETLDRVLKDLGVFSEDISYHGAFLPYGKAFPQEKLADNILLVGDAACFADPISGEGLYFALYSGVQAAGALSKEAYLKAIKPVYQCLGRGKRFQRFFYRPSTQRLFLHMIKERGRFLKFYMEEHVSFYHYPHGQMLKLMVDYKRKQK